MKKFYFIAVAIMVFAVQGYAQRQSGSRSVSAQRTTTSVRSQPSSRTSVSSRATTTSVRSQPSSRTSVSSRATTTSVRSQPSSRTSVSSRSTTTATSRTSTVSRGSTRSTSTPRVEPRHDNHHHNVHHGGHHHHAPHFSHGHRYHHHHCVFDAWRWITYLNYTNRFVCHSYYADRFFDTMLGYYVYGSMDNPNKIQVGNVTFYRYNDYLGVHNNQYKSYSLNQNQHLIYYIGYTTVDVVIQNGYARLYIYDDYGNEAVYYL